MRIDWQTIGRIIKRVGEEHLAQADRLRELFEISIDEVAWRKGHRYLTLVADHARGCVVWGTEGKGQAAADAFFDELDPPPADPPAHAGRPSWQPAPAIMVPFGPCPTVPAGQGIPGAWLQDGSEIEPAVFARASRLTAVSMDMTGGYAKSVLKHAPQATVVIDNYHVVQLATKALDEVRREHWNELRATGDPDTAKQFKNSRWSLLKNPQDLSDQQAATLAAIKAGGGKTAQYRRRVRRVQAAGEHPGTGRPQLRVEHADVAPWAGLTVQDVDELLDRLLSRLSRCRLPPFIRLGKTIRKHREGILAARRLKLSNARAESLNNRVKLLVRRAYGFHSANAALALVHLACGPITLTLPHENRL